MVRKDYSRIVLFLLLCVGIPTCLTGTTVKESLAGGTLQYTLVQTSGTCYVWLGGTTYQQASYTVWQFSGFSFTDANGIVYTLSGTPEYFQSPGKPNCPPSGPFPSSQVTLTGGFGFNIVFDPCPANTCQTSYVTIPSGYINPKYIVTTVVYAPPGPSSYVQYGSSVETGNQVSESGSVNNSSSMTESYTMSWGLSMPYGGGKFAVGWNSSSTATQTSSETLGSSGTFTTSIKNAQSYQVYGFPWPWQGFSESGFNPHWYDQVYIWLNAVEPFNAPSSTNIVWFGYGWDACDPVDGIDNYFLSAGQLVGAPNFPLLAGDKAALGRGWATNPGNYPGQIPSYCDGQAFPSGSGPAINTSPEAADFENMAAVDPLLNLNYQLNLQSNGITTGDGRYTRMAGFVANNAIQPPAQVDIITKQASPGSNPNVLAVSAAYTSSSDLGQSATYSYSQTFGTDISFSQSMFLVNLTDTLQTSNTITTTYTTKSDITTTTTDVGGFQIVSPPCNVVGGACSPVYNGPTEWDVYQDNKFGTFMFWPLNCL